MQQVQPSPLPRQVYERRTLGLAWLVLLVAFAFFCALLTGLAFSAWSYYTHADDARDSLLIVRGPSEWITWKPASRTVFQRVEEEQVLHEGDEVRIANSAGYGQVATIRLFDQSTLDMWASADVRLLSMRTSRWNNTLQEVTLEQSLGYVRYDLQDSQPYQRVVYHVELGDAWVEFAPGGSYSIEVLPSERVAQVAGASVVRPMQTDIAVRSGMAIVHGASRSVTLIENQRVLVNAIGEPGPTLPARWELIQDGSFSMYSEEEYNNTTLLENESSPTFPRSQTWYVYGVPPEAGSSGFFRLSRGCLPPDASNDCDPREQRNAAWFFRSGRHTRSFTTGVYQELGRNGQGVDVSEYRSLVFSVWARILDQSIPLTGEQGTECPLMIRLLGKKNNPTDPEQERVICLYTGDQSESEAARWPGVAYIQIDRYEWYNLSIELRDPIWMPDFRYLRRIEIYANGHDYNSQVTGVSLIGSQYVPERSPLGE
jgi:hypothetical protein